jgi:hypothetical protein
MKLGFKSILELAFCPGAGAADNSCSSNSSGPKSGEAAAPKFGGEATKRILLAAQASIKAKDEKNNIKAAQLHGKAARANEKAANQIKKDPSYGKIPGAKELLHLHLKKQGEHEREARELSQKLLGASAGKLQQYKQEAAVATTKAVQASKFALGGGKDVKFYSSGGAAPALNKAIAYARAHDAHNKAADAHTLAGNHEKAAYHKVSAKQMEKEFELYRSMM